MLGPDANFQAWRSSLVTYANANLAALGLTTADTTPVPAAQGGRITAFPAHVAAVYAAAQIPPPAAALAWRRADSMPSVTKWNVVPPCITMGLRGWRVRTNVGAW